MILKQGDPRIRYLTAVGQQGLALELDVARQQAEHERELAAIRGGAPIIPSAGAIVSSQAPVNILPSVAAPVPNHDAPGYVLGAETEEPSNAFNYGEEKDVTETTGGPGERPGSNGRKASRKKPRRKKAAKAKGRSKTKKAAKRKAAKPKRRAKKGRQKGAL